MLVLIRILAQRAIVYNLILFSFHYGTRHQNILTVISNIKIHLRKSTVRTIRPYEEKAQNCKPKRRKIRKAEERK
jgi:hypothetical protein